jgi:hypothetical protein
VVDTAEVVGAVVVVLTEVTGAVVVVVAGGLADVVVEDELPPQALSTKTAIKETIMVKLNSSFFILSSNRFSS